MNVILRIFVCSYRYNNVSIQKFIVSFTIYSECLCMNLQQTCWLLFKKLNTLLSLTFYSLLIHLYPPIRT